MDTHAPRHGGFRALGIERLSYSVPDSFFPLEDAPAPSTRTNSSTCPAQTWSNHFEGPRDRTQLRAWSRVEWPSNVARNFSGLIMKRVGFPTPCDTTDMLIPVPATPEELDALAEDGMPMRRVARRLNAYEPSAEEWRMEGKPLSSLEMTGLKMMAQADVVYCLRTYPTSTTRAETRQRRAGHYVQTVPLKRRAGATPCAGNKLRTYTEILKLPKMPIQFRVPARQFSVLPSPQATSPTLSPIALFTPNQEPVTPAAVMEPPRCMSDAKSPTKRSPRHKSPPIKNEGPPISEPAVKLLPATTPRIEPSPVKAASPPPATPLGESRRLRGILKTPSTFPKAMSIGTAFAGMQRYSGIRRGGAATVGFSPTKLFGTPCPAHHRIQFARQPSPAKRSVMETPSRPVAGKPMSPRIFDSISHTVAAVPSPIAFVSTVFPDSPARKPVVLPSSTPQKPTNFDFGTASPGFNSVTWLNDAEAMPRPLASLKKGSRRQSEPLIRGCLKTQNRRQTMSPRKLVFQADEIFAPSGGQSRNRRQTLPPPKLMPQGGQTFTQSGGLFSPVKRTGQTMAASFGVMKPASPGWSKLRNSRRSLDRNTSRRASNEVLSIDMRQNSDIFGSKPVSLSMSPILGASLASIVESGREMEGSEEPAELQLFSPSVEIESRREAEKTPRVEAPAVLEQVAVQDTPVSPIVDSPTGGLGIVESLPSVDSPLISIEERQEVADAEPSAIAQSPSPVTSTAASKEQRLSSSPTLNLSFTPVNSRSSNAGDASVQLEELIPESPLTVTTEIVETVTAQSHDYDSPGRDYMREFIRRSRPKRPSTTESGSPIGLSVKRQPLGPKSPNAESPSKNKRKLEKEPDEHESPLKRTSNASPKKIRRYGKNFIKGPTANEEKEEQTETLDVPAATDSAANVHGGDETGSDNLSRRSSRLRSQTRLPSAKSAIPTPIKIGLNNGPTLNAAVRSVQQDLTNQTRMNTRKNRGNAEYPAQVLAKKLDGMQAELDFIERESSAEPEARKCVNWSNPLAMYQEVAQQKEEGKPKKAKSSTAKTVQMSGIAKPVTRAKTTADKERTARLAEHFGMVSNGTPAKPQRSTRSRMRI
ncbi:hypothetical protein A9K55_001942 [Cordyceps militaris]|uniref:Uncharacterized protein n=1 Tax=Cordyceps militaris TaxID=73501 RepID=A0A2H4SQX7_CORMI|nr:hypothetical protein A9K55_001942 [Cordyceps militaris]